MAENIFLKQGASFYNLTSEIILKWSFQKCDVSYLKEASFSKMLKVSACAKQEENEKLGHVRKTVS